MALRNLEVVVTVVDKASKGLDDVQKKVKQTGQSANQASVDFTKFNRTLFATTAFVGTFIKGFSTLLNSFDAGSELDRLSNQFERVLGPKGNLFAQISNLTDASIDKFEAMREGISLRSLGIIHSTDQLADVVSKAGVAAKLAGKDSGEGIKTYSEFLKDGNVSHLEFLNLIAKSNPALETQMAILHKAGGMMGGVISLQTRLALGQSLLNAAVRGNLKGFRDLRDILLDAKQNFSLFRGELGRLLMTAVAPLIDKFSMFALKLSLIIDNVRKNEKNLMFLVKAVMISTTVVLGLAAALGTLRLATMALTSIGLGLPRLLFLMSSLSLLFMGITSKAEKFTDKLKIFAGFVKGVWQLVTSLDKKTGIAQIDEDLKQLLEKNGIFIFAQNVARAISVVNTVVKDMVDAFHWVSRQIDNIFGGMGRMMINLISKFKEPWDNFWINDSATPVQKFIRSFAVLGTTFATIFTGIFLRSIIGKISGGLLSKLPVIGGLFGGKGSGPKGTKSDPIFVKAVESVGKDIIGVGLSKIKGLFKDLAVFLAPVTKLFGMLNTVLDYTASYGIRGLTYTLSETLMPILRTFGAVVSEVVAPLAVFGSAIYGAIKGIIDTADEWGSFFKGIFDLSKAVTDVVLNFIESNKYLKAVKDTIVDVATGLFKAAKFILIDGPLTIMKMIAEGWQNIFGWMGIGAGALGKKMSDLAQAISPNSFPTAENSKDTGTTVSKSQNNAGQPGEKTNVSIPDTQNTQEDTINMLGEHLKVLTGSQRKMTQQTIEDALKNDSVGGSAITADEMQKIMQSSTNDQIGFLQKIERNTRDNSSGAVSSRRGQ